MQDTWVSSGHPVTHRCCYKETAHRCYSMATRHMPPAATVHNTPRWLNRVGVPCCLTAQPDNFTTCLSTATRGHAYACTDHAMQPRTLLQPVCVCAGPWTPTDEAASSSRQPDVARACTASISDVQHKAAHMNLHQRMQAKLQPDTSRCRQAALQAAALHHIMYQHTAVGLFMLSSTRQLRPAAYQG